MEKREVYQQCMLLDFLTLIAWSVFLSGYVFIVAARSLLCEEFAAKNHKQFHIPPTTNAKEKLRKSIQNNLFLASRDGVFEFLRYVLNFAGVMYIAQTF